MTKTIVPLTPAQLWYALDVYPIVVPSETAEKLYGQDGDVGNEYYERLWNVLYGDN